MSRTLRAALACAALASPLAAALWAAFAGGASIGLAPLLLLGLLAAAALADLAAERVPLPLLCGLALLALAPLLPLVQALSPALILPGAALVLLGAATLPRHPPPVLSVFGGADLIGYAALSPWLGIAGQSLLLASLTGAAAFARASSPRSRPATLPLFPIYAAFFPSLLLAGL